MPLQQSQFVDIHSHSSIQDPNILTIQSFDVVDSINTDQPYSVGFHPWYLYESKINDFHEQFKTLINHSNCFFIGELGFDRLKNKDTNLQRKIFEYQYEISISLSKPFIFHCVKSYDILLEYKKKLNPNSKWIVHGYRGNQVLAKQLIEKKIIISFGSSIMKENAFANEFRSLPLDSFFLETDNDKFDIISIYDRAAKLKKINIDTLKDLLWERFLDIIKK
jgi:TatD DNase family protein